MPIRGVCFSLPIAQSAILSRMPYNDVPLCLPAHMALTEIRTLLGIRVLLCVTQTSSGLKVKLMLP